MTDKVILVTPPDDFLEDSIRILAVDLDIVQSQLLSHSLTMLEKIPNITIYVWKNSDDINWLFDKKLKSDIILFNANSENQTLVGYFAAQKNSYYFGDLKTLHQVKKSAIYTVDRCIDILKEMIENYA